MPFTLFSFKIIRICGILITNEPSKINIEKNLLMVIPMHSESNLKILEKQPFGNIKNSYSMSALSGFAAHRAIPIKIEKRTDFNMFISLFSTQGLLINVC